MVRPGSLRRLLSPRSVRIVSFLVLLLFCIGAEPGGDGVRRNLAGYAVRVVRTVPETVGKVAVTGNAGVYLGHGLVLTAAHVAGDPYSPLPLRVVAGDRILPAAFVRPGIFEKTDVSLLSVDTEGLPPAMRALSPLAMCHVPPEPGQVVVVAEARGTSVSQIVSPVILPPFIPSAFASLIRDVETTGNSGSGVFDEDTGCLMGIMSRKIEWENRYEQTKESVKYFVPAADIVQFLGPVP
jgi:hypothetical protein